MKLTMAPPRILKEKSVEFTESPAPVAAERSDSGNPAHNPAIVNVPVTPGINLGEYSPESTSSRPVTSYFNLDPSKLLDRMAQSPSEAASGAKSNKEILRRMSLGGRTASSTTVDLRAANPSLGLSGGVISATFCIPNSVTYRKGQDWVRCSLPAARNPRLSLILTIY